MTTTPLPTTPVRSADELTRRWADLLDPPVFTARSLWLAWMGADGAMLPLLLPVDDLPAAPPRPGGARPGGRGRGGGAGLRTVRGGGGGGGGLHLALALCRPGPPEV